MNNKYKIIILGITIVIIFILFLRVLNSNKTYQPNQMIGKKIPEFILENLLNKNPKLDSNILSGKDFAVLNIWASWCIPCRIEHPFLMDLKNNNQLGRGLRAVRDSEEAAECSGVPTLKIKLIACTISGATIALVPLKI